MCGIAGHTRTGASFQGPRIRRALNDLIHRGPDELAAYETESIAMGAVRLRVLDLLTGSQPMTSQDQDAVIVFNGEIYNYRELRDQLCPQVTPFRRPRIRK